MILELPRLRLCGSIIKDDFCLGSMQYKTGIAALTKGNIVSVFGKKSSLSKIFGITSI